MSKTDTPVIETYSKLADDYDDEKNIESCWGKAAASAGALIELEPHHKIVVDMGCGTGRMICHLADGAAKDVNFVGLEPADRMRAIAKKHAQPNPMISIGDGRFEDIPLDDSYVDYLYSIMAFHWASDLDASVKELRRVLKSDGGMDLFFIGRSNGREFIKETTPVFLKYLGPKGLLEAAKLRKQLTREEAASLFATVFDSDRLTVEESSTTYYDTLEGHWGWWVRVEGQFLDIPEERRADCDEDIKNALSSLMTDRGIPYTIHQIHVRLR